MKLSVGLRSACFCLVAFSIPGSANAQKLFQRLSADTVSARAHADFAQCIMERSSDYSREAMVSHLKYPHRGHIRRLAARFETCKPGVYFVVEYPELADRLAEALVLARSGNHLTLRDQVLALTSVPPTDLRDGDEERRFARCAMREAPDESAALLLTGITTSGERDAVKSLSSKLATCFPGEKLAGFKALGARIFVRAAIATELLRDMFGRELAGVPHNA